MNQSCVASGSRQSAVFTAIIGLHFMAFLVVAAGLVPRVFDQPEEQPPILWNEEPEYLPPVVKPDPTQPVDAYSEKVDEPVVVIPTIAGADDERQVGIVETGSSGESVGVAMDPVEVVAPRRRTQDGRLAALINACYPAASRRNNEEGRLVARITIGADGAPNAWRVAQSSGFERLDQAAGCVIRRIEFIAGRQDGRAVAADAEMPITFQLD